MLRDNAAFFVNAFHTTAPHETIFVGRVIYMSVWRPMAVPVMVCPCIGVVIDFFLSWIRSTMLHSFQLEEPTLMIYTCTFVVPICHVFLVAVLARFELLPLQVCLVPIPWYE